MTFFYRQLTDIKETVKYTKGLKLTSGSEISGVEASLELAVAKGPFSATLSTTVTHEISQVNTHNSESSWSSEVLNFEFKALANECRIPINSLKRS